MEGTPPVASISPPLKAAAGSSSSSNRKRRLPNPKELIKHYESQGMETQEASLKVIEDLQKVLFRVVTSSSRPGAAKGRNSGADVVNSRLMRLEMKLDSKPGYPQTLAIGVASGAVLRGIETVFPRILSAFADIWNAVRSSTSGSDPHP